MKSQYKASLHDILKSKPWVSVTGIQWHSVLHYKRQHLQWTKPYHPCMVLILSFLRQSLQQACWCVLTVISWVCGDQTCMAVFPLLCCRLLQPSNSPAEVRSVSLLTYTWLHGAGKACQAPFILLLFPEHSPERTKVFACFGEVMHCIFSYVFHQRWRPV